MQFYEEHYPEVLPYVGIRGLEPDPNEPGTSSMQVRSQQDFYYPVSYVEPVLPNAAAIDFDLYSSASRRATIEAALASYQPTLTRRLRLVQETDPSAYSVLLMHPGIPLEAESPTTDARDLSLMVIRIPSLLERSVRDLQKDRLAVYLYDVTEAAQRSEAQFLGAIQTYASGSSNDPTFLPEVDYATFAASYRGRQDFIHQDTLHIGSSQWIVAVVAMEGHEYKANITFVVLGGSVLFCATVCLAIWMVQNAKRTLKLERVLEQAEAEKRIVTDLFPSTVRDRLIQDATLRKNGGRNGGNISNSDHDKNTPNPMKQSVTVGGVYGTKPSESDSYCLQHEIQNGSNKCVLHPFCPFPLPLQSPICFPTVRIY